METFISSMLDRLLMTSVQTTVLVAVAWLLCRPALRLSPATQCWLWWLVALQAVLGLFVDPVRLPWLPDAPAAAAILESAADALPAAASPLAVAGAADGPSPWQVGLLSCWAVGIAVMLLATLREWRRARRLLARSLPCADMRRAHAIVAAAKACGLRSAPRLRVSSDVGSPMLVGPLRPVLLLPAGAALAEEELGMALAHELAHLRRADLLLGLVPALARHVFFFHPLVHVAVREYGIAREAACDAAVVQAGSHSPHRYGELLLRLGTASASPGSLAAVSPTFRALSRRLVLLQEKACASRAGTVVLLLFALAGVLPLRLVAAVEDAPMPAAIVTPAMPAAAPRPVAPAAPVRSVASSQAPTASPKVVQRPVQAARAVRVAAVVPPDSKAAYAFRPDAADYYPAASAAAGESGIAKVRLCYDDRGSVIASTLAQGSGFASLDDAAVAMGWRFRMKPAVEGGVAKADCVVVPVKFQATGVASTAAAPQPAMPVATPVAASVPPTDTVAGIAFRPDAADYYPNVSLTAGEEGIVKLRLCYTETGKVIESTVAEASAFPRLDDAAVRMGKQFRFRPAVTGGVPKADCAVVPVRFTRAGSSPTAATYGGPRMSANFQDIDVAALVRVIADSSGRRIVVDPSVSSAGTMTLRVSDVPWEQLLDLVVRTKGLQKRVTDNEIVISAR